MTPRITVLLATYQGVEHLAAQLDSIAAQRGVQVTVIASDDGSTDGTHALLAARAEVTVLPALVPTGSAAANFARLLRDADLTGADLVALADQDDVWAPDKLARHAALLVERGVEGVSSDVVAVSPDGRRRRVRKAFGQRAYDWVCESPGPGSTFLLSPRLVALARAVLVEHAQLTARVDYHDWLLYALCRARGWGWHIDAVPSVDYRQHASNVMGANHGARAAAARLGLVHGHWHRDQARTLLELGQLVAPDPAPLAALARDLDHRLALTRRVPQLRRRARDRAVLAALVLAGIW